MSKKPVLVVMAAGMGSRYGGLKQIDPIGKHGEAILDYSLYDAHEAGFETAVIIIKKQIEKDFMQTVGKRLEACPMEIRYAYQELEKVPTDFQIPAERTKPWGTCHAVLCAKEAIGDAPFAVVNADDYYGKSAFRVMYDALCSACDRETYDYCMVGYSLFNTVTENGSVSRGVCTTNDRGHLVGIQERTRIEQQGDVIRYTEDGENWVELPRDTVVSMNLFGFTPSFLQEISQRFPIFLNQSVPANPAKAEYYLPGAVSDLLAEGKATVRMLHSADRWYGVTYAADKPVVVGAIEEMTRQGLYPADGLWA